MTRIRELSAGTSNALWGITLLALSFPTLVTWVYFVSLKGQPAVVQQSAYTLGKIIQFCIPIAWVFVFQRDFMGWRPQRPRGIGLGIVFGFLVAAAMIGVYYGALKPSGFFNGPGEEVRRKIAGLGITATWKYLLLGVFYALCHSFLEEYYWRWFVFRELKLLVLMPAAVAISSLGFMSHHILLLATFFGWQSPATWLFSGGVAVGGAVWAWLYDRTGSLAVTWAGHCLVDAAIFVVGYDLAGDMFQ